MTSLNLFYKIKEAYETSTHNNNRFLDLLCKIKWDSTFSEDEEHYFIKGDLIFTTPSFDPFNMKWEPAAIFGDGSMVTIK